MYNCEFGVAVGSTKLAENQSCGENCTQISI